ncbi:hypothetical protein A2U01_0104053, partial [Trifolium medium]|nr:hypothetical protein [Trifolium medium]
ISNVVGGVVGLVGIVIYLYYKREAADPRGSG